MLKSRGLGKEISKNRQEFGTENENDWVKYI